MKLLNPETTVRFDAHRAERLLEMSSSILGNRSVNLRWPSQDDEIIASRALDPGEPRDQIVTLESQLRQHSVVMRAGATAITLPVLADSTLPSIDRETAAAWGESSGDILPAGFDIVKSLPRRLSAYVTISKMLLKTSPVLGATYIEAQLLAAIGAALDKEAVDPEAAGSLLSSVIPAYELADSLPIYTDLTAMEKVLTDAFAETGGAIAWLCDTATRKHLRDTPRAEGLAPIWNDNTGPLGYAGFSSPRAEADTLVIGNFADFLIIQSGVVTITPNPYSEDVNGFVRVLVESYFDALPLRPESFVKAAQPA